MKKNILFSVEFSRKREYGRVSYPSDYKDKVESIRQFLISRYGDDFVSGFRFDYGQRIELGSYSAKERGRNRAGVVKEFFKNDYIENSIFEFTNEDARKWDEMKSSWDLYNSNRTREKSRGSELKAFIYENVELIKSTGAKLSIRTYTWYEDGEDTRSEFEKIRSISIIAGLISIELIDERGIFKAIRITSVSRTFYGTPSIKEIKEYSEGLLESIKVIELLEKTLIGIQIYTTI